MAVIVMPTPLYVDGAGEITALYRVPKVTTNDTMDIASVFSKIKAATCIAAGSATTLIDTPAFTGTVLTFDGASYAADTLVVTVVGDSV